MRRRRLKRAGKKGESEERVPLPLPGSWREGLSPPIVPSLARTSGDIPGDATSGGLCNSARPRGAAEVRTPGFLSTPHPKGAARVGIPERLVTSHLGGVHQRHELLFLLTPTPLESED